LKSRNGTTYLIISDEIIDLTQLRWRCSLRFFFLLLLDQNTVLLKNCNVLSVGRRIYQILLLRKIILSILFIKLVFLWVFLRQIYHFANTPALVKKWTNHAASKSLR